MHNYIVGIFLFSFFWGCLVGAALIGDFGVQNPFDGFYSITFGDIVKSSATIITALIFGFYLNNRLSQEFRVRGIYKDSIDYVHLRINEIYYEFNRYIGSPTSISKQNILTLFTDVRISLSVFKKNVDRNLPGKSAACQIFVDRFMSFFRILTDSPFGSDAPEYTSEKRAEITRSLEELIGSIQRLKLEMYQ